MASLSETSPVTVPTLIAAKGKERIAMLSLYDAPSAAAADAAGIDVFLVGDSVEMAVYGRPNTLSATMDTMVRHARAVSDATSRALVVGDMPFLSYQADPREAVRNAGRFLSEGGCGAVKLEGGTRSLPAVEAILAADIPVMGHVGLTPQSYRKLGGFKVQGREAAAARADRRRCAGAGRGRLLHGRARVRAGCARSRDHARDPDPDDRHRRRALLRRPGPRLPRRPRADPRPAAKVRPALRRARARDGGGRPGFPGGCPDGSVSIRRRVLRVRAAPTSPRAVRALETQ